MDTVTSSGDAPIFVTRAAGALVGEIVTGVPARVLQDVDEAYKKFLAQCEANKRAIGPEENEMLIKQEFTGETPPAGVKQAVLVGERDEGMKPGFQGKPPVHKITLMWQIADRDSQGRRFNVYQLLSATWGSSQMPSNLRKAVDMLRAGKGLPALTDEDVKAGVDTSQYFGDNAQLLLVHNPGTGGRVFANVKMVMPYTGTTKLVAEAREDNGGDYAARQQANAQDALRAAAREHDEGAATDPAAQAGM